MNIHENLRDCLRGEERIGYAVGAISLWSVLFYGALSKFF